MRCDAMRCDAIWAESTGYCTVRGLFPRPKHSIDVSISGITWFYAKRLLLEAHKFGDPFSAPYVMISEISAFGTSSILNADLARLPATCSRFYTSSSQA